MLHKQCFQFSWDGCNTQEKSKSKVMQNFFWWRGGGGGGVGQRRCIMGNVKVVYAFPSLLSGYSCT